LEKLESSNARQAFQAFSFSLSASCVLVLSSSKRNIVKCIAALNLYFEKKYEAIQTRCDLKEIQIIDQLGMAPFHDNLVNMKEMSKPISASSFAPSANAIFGETSNTSIVVDMLHGKLVVEILSVPLEIYLNKIVIHALLTEFALPKQTRAKRLKRKMAGSNRRVTEKVDGENASIADSALASSLSQAVTQRNADVHIKLKVHGPKIIIPEDCTKDIGCLLLDCGFIDIDCKINSTGFVADVQLLAVNAGLPLRISDIYALQGTSLYLIKVSVRSFLLWCFDLFNLSLIYEYNSHLT
jgi:hypothetical protein